MAFCFNFALMKNIYASIITIGDELLIGQVLDTNSAWIAQQLNKIGIALNNRISVGDDAQEIRKALDFGSKNSQIVLITGGLGPTNDDITKKVLCDYFDGKLVVNQVSLDNVKRLFEKVYNKPVSEVNLKQAEVPDVCEVIQNHRGSAPGMVFKKDESIFISMPGVPYEMQGIMEEVISMLQKKFHVPAIIHKTILTSGIGESALAEKIKDFEDKLPKEIRLAYLPNYGMVRLRLSTSGFDKSKTENAIKNQFTVLKELVKEFMVADEDLTMQQVLGKLLLENKKNISTAESCTGGAIASLITSVAGSSAYFKGSVVSYSNRVKQEMLGVKKETLDTYGAVSEQTAREMLSGILKQMKTDFGIAVTGVMGPGGGSEEKPVGTVYIAVGNKQNQVVQKFKQRFSREKNIEVTSVMALNLMRKFIVNGES
jgi:nicotinamide-nucleotide amidase